LQDIAGGSSGQLAARFLAAGHLRPILAELYNKATALPDTVEMIDGLLRTVADDLAELDERLLGLEVNLAGNTQLHPSNRRLLADGELRFEAPLGVRLKRPRSKRLEARVWAPGRAVDLYGFRGRLT